LHIGEKCVEVEFKRVFAYETWRLGAAMNLHTFVSLFKNVYRYVTAPNLT